MRIPTSARPVQARHSSSGDKAGSAKHFRKALSDKLSETTYDLWFGGWQSRPGSEARSAAGGRVLSLGFVGDSKLELDA